MENPDIPQHARLCRGGATQYQVQALTATLLQIHYDSTVPVLSLWHRELE